MQLPKWRKLVSSYTSSSDSHRCYVLCLFALVLVPVLGLFTLGLYLQPLYGDLTRIGSYAEKDFGWNKPQFEFKHPLSEIGEYQRYYDIVVLGDSFSTGRPQLHWQNYLVAAKGWSIVTLNINEIKLEQVLENPVFRNTPPKIFILGTVERELPRRIAYEKSCDANALLTRGATTAQPSHVASLVQVSDFKGLAKYVERSTSWKSGIKLGYVKDYLWKSFLRISYGDAHTYAAKVELDRKGPFSSINKNTMLVYKDDFLKVSWWREMGLSEISCRIGQIRKQVETNRQTQFVLMVAPDKLTAYADFIRDKNLQKISNLSALSDSLPEIMPRIDLALTTAINKGEQDVYLPDDTHWGSSGYQIAAETLMTFLNNP